jgi:8-oxo-dGTP pyrophosphatase MutT (NUDIX family)
VLIVAGGEAEAGEPLEATANRELQEELGWRVICAPAESCRTRHLLPRCAWPGIFYKKKSEKMS